MQFLCLIPFEIGIIPFSKIELRHGNIKQLSLGHIGVRMLKI